MPRVKYRIVFFTCGFIYVRIHLFSCVWVHMKDGWLPLESSSGTLSTCLIVVFYCPGAQQFVYTAVKWAGSSYFCLCNAGITHTYIVTRWICYFLIAVAKHHDQKRITNVFCLWLHRHKSLSYQGGMTATQAWRQARKLNFHTLTKAQSSEGILEAGEAIHSQSPLLPSNASPNEVAPLRPLICHQEPRAKCSNV